VKSIYKYAATGRKIYISTKLFFTLNLRKEKSVTYKFLGAYLFLRLSWQFPSSDGEGKKTKAHMKILKRQKLRSK
jgi:hypothetical protein